MAECISLKPIYGYLNTEEPGWTGGAFSVPVMSANGYFSVQVPITITGVITGLTSAPAGTLYNNIQHGLIFQGNKVAVIESGVIKTPLTSYLSNDTFHIYRLDNIVYYLKEANGVDYGPWPGSIFYTSLAYSYGDVYLAASLYAVADQITEASFTEYTSANITAGLFLDCDWLGAYPSRFAVGLNGEVIWSQEEWTSFFVELTTEVNWLEFPSLNIEAGIELDIDFTTVKNTVFLVEANLGALWSDEAISIWNTPLELGVSWYQAINISVTTFNTMLQGDVLWASWETKDTTFEVGLTSTIQWIASTALSVAYIIPDLNAEVFWYGSQNAPINRIWFSLFLSGTQELSRFPPINIFPSCYRNNNKLYIPISDLPDLPIEYADGQSGNGAAVLKAMLLAARDHYIELEGEEQPITARPWGLTGIKVTPVLNKDLVGVKEITTDFRFSFIIEYQTEMVIEE